MHRDGGGADMRIDAVACRQAVLAPVRLPTNGLSAPCPPISATMRRPSRRTRQSLPVARKFWRMRSGARGSAEASCTSPRLSGRNSTTRQANPSANALRIGGKYGWAVIGAALSSSWISGSAAADGVFKNAIMPAGRSPAIPVRTDRRGRDPARCGRSACAGGTAPAPCDCRRRPPKYDPADFARRPEVPHAPRCRVRGVAPASPIPDNISSLRRVDHAAAQNHLTFGARDVSILPSRRYSTPIARGLLAQDAASPARRLRSSGLAASTRAADRRSAALQRRPLRIVFCRRPNPSCCAPL